MTMNPQVSMRHSITTRMLAVVFSIYGLIALLVTSVQILMEYSHMRDDIMWDLRGVQQVVELNLSTALLESDQQQLQVLIERIQQISFVEGVKVEDTAGNMLATSGVLDTLDTDFFGYTFLVHQFGDQGGTAILGQATLYTSNQVVLQRLEFGLGLTLVGAAFKTLAWWGIFLWIGHRMLTRPLERLATVAQQLDWKNLKHIRFSVDNQKTNEFSVLEKAFQGMLQKLSETHEAMEKLNQTLEDKVEERTKDLQSVQDHLFRVNEIAQEVSAHLDLKQATRVFIRKTVQAICPDGAGAILMYNAATECLVFYASYGLDQRYLDSFEVPVDPEKMFSYEVFQSQRSKIYQLEEFDQFIDEAFLNLHKGMKPVQELIAPVVSNGVSIGLVGLSQYDPRHPFTENSRQVLDAITLNLGHHFEHAKLYEESQTNQRQIAAKHAQLEQLSTQLSKYLSPQVYASIFLGEQDASIGSYRKKLTIFFSDLEGFTATTERMESEALTALLNDYLNEMSNIALDYGGTIDKFVGDGMMIFFGDPETFGETEDAVACVSMAIAMRQKMQELRKKWRAQGIMQPLRTRMGINTGYCTVGNFGSNDRLDYTIIGGQVNLASRLESNASSDQILISHETYVLIQDEIACQKKGQIKVKGIQHAIQTYQVIDHYESLAAKKERVRLSGEGYLLDVDLSSISSSDKAELTQVLEKALEQIETP